jgi:DNA-binding IclR family transcriptional regulator
MSDMNKETDRPLIEVLAKGTRILEALSKRPAGMTLHELSGSLGLAKSSAHRLLSAWIQLGYIERAEKQRFRLGFKIIELGARLNRQSSIVERSRAVLSHFHQTIDESVYLGVYHDGDVILVDAIESTKALRVCVDIGEKCWLHASAQGRCVAAWLSEARIQDILSGELQRITRHTNQNPDKLTEIFEKVRQQGYAVNYEETVEGAVCLGAPFFAGTDGPVLGAIGTSIPISRCDTPLLESTSILITHAADELTERLAGFPVEPDTRDRQHVISTQAERRHLELISIDKVH